MKNKVTILILIDGFLQCLIHKKIRILCIVTILILIDGFLQYNKILSELTYKERHNPYFNRWFSAMLKYHQKAIKNSYVTILILIDGFLQLNMIIQPSFHKMSHNPYFNRWFSAMKIRK